MNDNDKPSDDEGNDRTPKRPKTATKTPPRRAVLPPPERR